MCVDSVCVQGLNMCMHVWDWVHVCAGIEDVCVYLGLGTCVHVGTGPASWSLHMCVHVGIGLAMCSLHMYVDV